ncbi:LPXTG cell wall anchor domain-containing protein [Embleya sp. NPDC055664]
MSQSVNKKVRSAALVGALAFAALPLVGAGTAHATGDSQAPQCTKVTDTSFVYTVNDGAPVKSGIGSKQMPERPKKVVVKLSDEFASLLEQGCKYPVQLSTYSTQGPNWATSGTQKFIGWQTDTITKQNKAVTFDATKYPVPCFVQYDLLGNHKKYDGGQYPLPHYDDVYMDNLLGGWNGGTNEKCTGTPTPSTPATSKPPTTPPPATSAPSTGSAPTTATPVTSTAAPGTKLAETGGDSNGTAIIGASAGGVLVLGGGLFYVSRRRGNRGTAA